MTDERFQSSGRPQPGDGPELRPRPYQAAQPVNRPEPPAAAESTQAWRPGTPSDPEGTGVWTPSWDDDDDIGDISDDDIGDEKTIRGWRPPHQLQPQPVKQQAAPPNRQQTRQQPNVTDPDATAAMAPGTAAAAVAAGPTSAATQHFAPVGMHHAGRHHDPDATDVIPRLRPPLPREPELITHREPPPPPVPPPPVHRVPPDDDEEPLALTSEEEAALRRRKMLRRVRNIAAAVILAIFLIPILTFLIGYAAFEVPSFTAVANKQAQPVTVLYSDGQTELTTIRPPEGNRINVKHDEIPEHVRYAVLAAEDRTFYSNPGFDAKAIARAAWKQVNGEAGGGSGITQQYVKVATKEDDFSLKRKLKEVVIATKISRNTPKEEILENYLNIIYFGRQATGIQAASRAYFNKDVKDLTVSEGALLAGMIQSPSRSDPLKNPERATNRWNFVLDGMASQGWLSPADRAAQQFPPVIEIQAALPGAVNDYRLHIQEQVQQELADQGIDQDALNRFGGRVVTTIDKNAQDKALEAINKVLDGKPENLHASLVAVDPKTGGVRAYFGGNDGTGYDLAGGPAWQPGSSFKPFVMLAALEQDIGLGATYPGKGPLTFGDYKVDNSESADYPELQLKKAMTYSVNTAFVQLASDVGPEKVASAAHRAGIPENVNDKKTLVNPDGTPPGLAIGLGAYEVRTIDMAAAYATFAAQGTKRPVHFVQEYVGADNQRRYQHVEQAEPAFDPANPDRNTQLACNVTESMVEVAGYSKFPLAGNRPAAAKTGTAQRGSTGENANTWTVGYTPQVSAAVWVGDPAQTSLKLGNRDVFGATVAGPIWKTFMDSYLAGTKQEQFPKCKPIGKAANSGNGGGGGGPAAPPPGSATAPTTVPTTEPPTTLPPITLTRPPRPTRPSPTVTDPRPTCGGIFQPPCEGTTPPEPTDEPGPPPPGNG